MTYSTTLAQSRRHFIKTAAMGTACAGVAAGAGIARASEANEAAATVNQIVWDEETDVLVVGSGMAGLAAACTVATEGDGATCLLLEKGTNGTGNGNTPYSSGYVLWTEDVNALFDYLKTLRGGYTATPDEVLRAYAEGVAENLDWVKALGADTDDMIIGAVDGNPGEFGEFENSDSASSIRYDKANSKSYTHVAQLLDAYLQNNASECVERRFEAPLVALVQDPQTKAVLGGVYEHEGAQVYVKARKGVVMCCGGFENDPVMLQDYLSITQSHPVAAQGNTGDGHRICAKLGVDMWHMNAMAGMWTNGVTLSGDGIYAGYRGMLKELGITVGINGRRYYMDWDGCTTYEAQEIGSDPSVHVGMRHGHTQFGGEWPHLPQPAVSWFVFDAEAQASGAFGYGTGDPAEEGFGYAADTVEELAQACGVPVDELVRTVEQWNACCEAGEDVYFHRPESTLTPIATPPFYAVKCEPEILNTDGGPRRSARGEVLDPDGSPIPGLYAAGEFGSIWSNYYQGGGNLGECCAFGRICVRSILGK